MRVEGRGTFRIGIMTMVLLLAAPAGGDVPRSSVPDHIFEKLVALHEYKKPPGPRDWLSHHHEELQTFGDFVEKDAILPNEDRRVIYIAKIGTFDETRSRIIDQTARFMEVFYELPVAFLEPVPLSEIPPTARRVHPHTGDRQILVPHVVEKILLPRKPDDAFCVIGFTGEDLWPGEGWNFVFGQANIEDRVGVWSIYRNGDPNESPEAYNLTLFRTINTGTHEAGHMFGIYHEIVFEGLMNGSNHRQETDERPLYLSPISLKKLQWATGFDLAARFSNLAAISREYGFDGPAGAFERFEKAVRELGSD